MSRNHKGKSILREQHEELGGRLLVSIVMKVSRLHDISIILHQGHPRGLDSNPEAKKKKNRL